MSNVQVITTSPQDSMFPARPALGRNGRAIRVETNFFELELLKKSSLYQLDVKFSETRLPPDKRREVFQQIRIKHPKLKIYFDGTAIAATNAKFEGGAEIMTTEVVLPPSTPNSKPIKVDMKIVDTLTYADIADFLSGKQVEIPKDYMKLLNIYLFHFAATDPALVTYERSKSFFMLNGRRVKLYDGLDLLFGGFMSVRWGGVDLAMRPLQKLYVNIDTVATTFYSKGPLLDRLKAVLPRANFNQKLYPNDITVANRALAKLKFQVTHRGPSWNKKYTISRISTKSAAETFFKVDGKNKSVAQHFQDMYQIELRFPNLPCVVVESDPARKMEVPFEVCEIPDGIRHKGRLTGPQTADIIRQTAARPQERKGKILDLLKLVSDGQKKDNTWNLKLDNKMAVVDARVLIEPELQYGGKFVRPRQGAWNTVGYKFHDPKPLDSWALIDFKGDAQTANNFVSGFVQSANQRGMNVSSKPTIMTSNPNANLDQIIDQAVAKTPNCKMFMFILPFDSGTLYPNLKRISDCRLGIPTQCVVHKKLFKANDQYYTNVALKVNHKLGGTNNKLKEKLPLFDKPTMVLGADVTHPGGGSNAPSIASVVGSITPDANLYVARVEFQESRIEYIEKFQSMFFHCLRLFKTKSGVLPERILYYRDGVGEGMFKEIKRLEIEAMLKAFDQVPKPYSPNIKTPNYRPTISMIVVQKRHHARFFPINPQDQDRSSNCPAGMVVETGITHPREFDFYLQSQAGLQGTSRPTHYHVLHDENKFTPDALQELTNKMCYLQGRCTRSVRIVPAVYHADLVCFRARCHLNNLDAWSHSSQGKSDVKPEDLASKISQKLERTMWWM